jgi:hypothetical protein
MRGNSGERGNILFMILAAILILGMLTMAVSRQTTQQASILPHQTRDDQINRMLTHASTLATALQKMMINGEDAATLYTNLSLLKQGDAGFETSPNNLKIYHPLGGGVEYLSASAPDAEAVATDYKILPGAIVTGVGATDAVVGDILFAATIASEDYCERINQVLTGSATVPAMDSDVFTDLFTDGTAVTLDGTNCASCVNAARLCVTNGASDEWGFYAALFPG